MRNSGFPNNHRGAGSSASVRFLRVYTPSLSFVYNGAAVVDREPGIVYARCTFSYFNIEIYRAEESRLVDIQIVTIKKVAMVCKFIYTRGFHRKTRWEQRIVEAWRVYRPCFTMVLSMRARGAAVLYYHEKILQLRIFREFQPKLLILFERYTLKVM